MKSSIFLFLINFTLIIACNNSTSNSGMGGDPRGLTFSDEWILPKDEIIDGGPGLDGIPSIDNPDFAPVQTIQYVDDDRLIAGVRVGNNIRAYPHQVLDWHEIVNDQTDDDVFFVLTYCPLTGTAICWERGASMEFGVSGLLFRNNLILYDRQTASRYSQMQLRGVNGPMAHTYLQTIPVVETTWKTWKTMYPNSEILTDRTGFNRDYSGFAYGSVYLEKDSATNFPVKNHDDRLLRKERVHGIIGRKITSEGAPVRVYPIDNFGNNIKVINDEFEGQNIVIAGSSDNNFAVSFSRTMRDSTVLQFEVVQNDLPVIMKDQEGNYWDVFGFATQGPRIGSRLSSVKSYTGYWFAWADFFPGLEIYEFE
jgi:hypothetical protein